MPASAEREAVDAFIAAGRRGVRFPAKIEVLFDNQRRSYRARSLISTLLPAALCYNAFLPIDILLLPATTRLAIVLHMMLTAWIVATAIVFAAKPLLLVRELACVSIPALMVAQILIIFTLNGGVPAVADYQYLAVMIVVFMNVNVRPDFRFALATTIALAAAHSLALAITDVSMATRLIGAGSMGAAGYLTLTANYRMERDARYAFIMRLQDKLRREAAEAEAERDPLTELYNRRYLHERAVGVWQAAEPSTSVALLMVDVDCFKQYNDRYGHPAGDVCLKRVAGVIRQALRGSADVAARFGGEEFVVLLPDAELGDALKIAERIRRAVEDCAITHAASSLSDRLTASVGVAAGPAASFALAELVTEADKALYAAKREGRNRIWPPLVERTGSIIMLPTRIAG